MTLRERRRRNLLAEIRQRMLKHGFFIFVLFCFSCHPALAAEVKSTDAALAALLSETKPVAKAAVKPAVTAKAAEKKEDPAVKYIEKKVKGVLTYVHKKKIAVEFAETEEGAEEMLIPLHKDLKLVKAKKLSDFTQGDTVEVKYRQSYKEPEKGKAPVYFGTVALEIVLLKKAKLLPAPVEGLLLS